MNFRSNYPPRGTWPTHGTRLDIKAAAMSRSSGFPPSAQNTLTCDRPVTAEQHAELVTRIRADADRSKALQARLLASIKGAVTGLAFRLPNRGSCELDDLLQAANLAILAGLHRFDPDRADFLGWALRDGRAAMVREIQRQGYDVHASDGDRARGVAAPQIAGGFGTAADQQCHAARMTIRNAQATQRSRSGLPKETPRPGLVCDEVEGLINQETPESTLSRAELTQALARALTTLGPRQREIVCRYYGVNGYERHSMRDIEHTMRIGRATIRAAVDGALAHLSAHLNGTR